MKKAIIAISGGIDSAVATAIAKNEGYELYGKVPLISFTLGSELGSKPFLQNKKVSISQ